MDELIKKTDMCHTVCFVFDMKNKEYRYRCDSEKWLNRTDSRYLPAIQMRIYPKKESEINQFYNVVNSLSDKTDERVEFRTFLQLGRTAVLVYTLTGRPLYQEFLNRGLLSRHNSVSCSGFENSGLPIDLPS